MTEMIYGLETGSYTLTSDTQHILRYTTLILRCFKPLEELREYGYRRKSRRGIGYLDLD